MFVSHIDYVGAARIKMDVVIASILVKSSVIFLIFIAVFESEK